MVNHNSKHQKAKGVNKDVVATISHTKGVNKDDVVAISHNEYKEVLLNKKCLKHSMNRIPRNDRRIGTNEINKISLSRLNGKIYLLNNGYDGLDLGFQS